MKVEIYWNARIKTFSVRKDRKVVGHASKLMIRDATFHVSEAGRQRVLNSGHKNVHAFVRGELEGVVWDTTFVFGHAYEDNWTSSDRAYAQVARKRLGTEVRYNPRVNSTFVDIYPTGGPRTEAPMAYLRRCDNSPIILTFDPLLMTADESCKGE